VSSSFTTTCGWIPKLCSRLCSSSSFFTELCCWNTSMLTPSMRHMYHMKTCLGQYSSVLTASPRSCYLLDLYGTNFEATSSMSCSEQYFHFPPLFLSLATSLPRYMATPRLGELVNGILWHDLARHCPYTTYCTPRSPVAKMSVLLSPKQANISTDHLPRPRTATSFCNTSSSEASMSIFAVSSPLTNFSAKP